MSRLLFVICVVCVLCMTGCVENSDNPVVSAPETESISENTNIPEETSAESIIAVDMD